MSEAPDPQDLDEARRIIQAQAEMIARLQARAAILQADLLAVTNAPKYPVRTLTEARACYLRDKLFSISNGIMWSHDCRDFLTLEINDAFRLPIDCSGHDVRDVMKKVEERFPDDCQVVIHEHPNGKQKFWILERI